MESSDKLCSSAHGTGGGASKGTGGTSKSAGGTSKSGGGSSRSSGGARGASGGTSRGTGGGSRRGSHDNLSSLGGSVLGVDHLIASLRGGNGGGTSALFSAQLSQADRGSVLNPTTFKGDPYWSMEGRDRGYLGLYPPNERQRRIDRFLNKRRSRIWSKSVKYDVRKNFADSRIRVKGRFVKKEEQEYMLESLGIISGGGGSGGSSGGMGGDAGHADEQINEEDGDRDGTEDMYDDEMNDHEGVGRDDDDDDDDMEEEEEEEEE